MSTFLFWIIDYIVSPFIKKDQKKVVETVKALNILKILNICSNTGKQCFYFLEKEIDCIGIDNDFKAVRYSYSKYPGNKFVCGDAVELPFKKAVFAGVASVFAIHDKPIGIQKKILEELKRVLSDNGFIVFMDIDPPAKPNFKSNVAHLWTIVNELFSGHFFRGIEFLRKGGISNFIKENHLCETKREKIKYKNVSIIVAKPMG